MVKKLFFVFLISLSNQCIADTILHDFKIIEVIDGDTVRIKADFLPKPLPPTLKLRIIGIDTPEKGSRAKCEFERTKADEAANFLKDILSNQDNVKVSIVKWDKYGGRVLGDIHLLSNQKVSDTLLQAGYAVPYHGKKKVDWCNKL